MVVNVEFLDMEPIENVITSMHFKIDKTIFFGYSEVIDKRRDSITAFLRNNCGVREVVYYSLSHNKIEKIVTSIKNVVLEEKREGNDILFDITGGEELILVAFGMIANEYKLPIHLYDIPKNKLIELDSDNLGKISDVAQVREVEPTLDMMINLQGCTINHDNMKSIHSDLTDEEFVSDVEKLFEIQKNNKSQWNFFTRFLDENMRCNDTCFVCVNVTDIDIALRNHKYVSNLFDDDVLNNLLTKLNDFGIIENYVKSASDYSFKYKNPKVAYMLFKEGYVLEHHALVLESADSKECLSGVFIDWDGRVHENLWEDVWNEIDVLSLKGVTLTFASCKCGKLDKKTAKNFLYELDAVARKCGGKYARKKLYTMYETADIFEKRAREMGIEVITL